jgi:hypothetical protein
MLERLLELAKLSHNKLECESLMKQAQREHNAVYFVMAIALMEPSEHVWSALVRYLAFLKKEETQQVLPYLSHWTSFKHMDYDDDNFSDVDYELFSSINSISIKNPNKAYEFLGTHGSNIEILSVDLDVSEVFVFYKQICGLKNLTDLRISFKDQNKKFEQDNEEITNYRFPTQRVLSHDFNRIDQPKDKKHQAVPILYLPVGIKSLTINYNYNAVKVVLEEACNLEFLDIQNKPKYDPNGDFLDVPLKNSITSLSIEKNVNLSDKDKELVSQLNIKYLYTEALFDFVFKYHELEGFCLRASDSNPMNYSKVFKSSEMYKLNTLIVPNVLMIDGELRYILGKNKTTLESIFVRTRLSWLNGWSCHTLRDFYVRINGDATEQFMLDVPNVKNMLIETMSTENALLIMSNVKSDLLSLILIMPEIPDSVLQYVENTYSNTLQVLDITISESVGLETFLPNLINSDLATVINITVDTSRFREELGFLRNSSRNAINYDKLYRFVKESLNTCSRTIMVQLNGKKLLRTV